MPDTAGAGLDLAVVFSTINTVNSENTNPIFVLKVVLLNGKKALHRPHGLLLGWRRLPAQAWR